MATFLASSRQSADIAKGLAGNFAKAGLTVLPWWEARTFPRGAYNLDAVIELTRVCAAAVFVICQADEVWPRDHSKASRGHHSALHEMLLEFGAFCSRLELSRLFIVTDAPEMFPHELQSRIFSIEDKVGQQGLIARLIHWSQSEPPHEFSVYTPKRREEVKPRKGSAKIAYRGIRGASAWAALEDDQEYHQRRSAHHVIEYLSKCGPLDELRKCRDIISFGPGIGKFDCEVVSSMHFDAAQYIPVDINYYLAVYAAHRVDSENEAVRSLRGVVGDFELEWRFVARSIKKCSYGPRLYMMLGGTFGNLEEGEGLFFDHVSSLMAAGDFFILDSFFTTPLYEPKSDPLLRADDYLPRMKTFLANGVEQREGIRASRVERNFSRYVHPWLQPAAPSDRYTHIFIKTRSGDVVMSVKRHSVSNITKIASLKGLTVVDQAAVDIPGNLSRHVLIFQKSEHALEGTYKTAADPPLSGSSESSEPASQGAVLR